MLDTFQLEQLVRKVDRLEQTLAGDLRMILNIMQGHKTTKDNVPEYENITIDATRTRYVFQRSVSEPKPISSKAQHSQQQALHRFASFNRAFDFDKPSEPWPEDTVFKEKSVVEEEERACSEDKPAPIAKLESLDELDLESPLSSPKKEKK